MLTSVQEGSSYRKPTLLLPCVCNNGKQGSGKACDHIRIYAGIEGKIGRENLTLCVGSVGTRGSGGMM
jgi:hypothetical protein